MRLIDVSQGVYRILPTERLVLRHIFLFHVVYRQKNLYVMPSLFARKHTIIATVYTPIVARIDSICMVKNVLFLGYYLVRSTDGL